MLLTIEEGVDTYREEEWGTYDSETNTSPNLSLNEEWKLNCTIILNSTIKA